MSTEYGSIGIGSSATEEEYASHDDADPLIPLDVEHTTDSSPKIRNLSAFWLFGLCNNFAYVIMLSAAHDILKEQENSSSNASTEAIFEEGGKRFCNQISTGAVLLADILPALIIKLTAPFFMEIIPYGIRIFLVIVAQIASYLVVAFSVSISMSLFGVVCAALGSGLGEISFLSLSSFFETNAISTWSSGTGAAGLFGSLAYAGLTQAGLSPRETVLIMLVVPVIFALTYWVVTVFPASVHKASLLRPRTWLVPRRLITEDQQSPGTSSPISQRGCLYKLQLIMPLLKFMIPLALVYFAEYLINQGLQELIYFDDIWLTQADQYRWYQVTYQLGVLISRSSVNFLTIPTPFLPLLALIQFGNLGVFVCEAYFLFIPSIWIVLVLILLEGLLGGSAYVNTFYQIKQQVAAEHGEFSLGVASAADSSGILIAGVSSIPVHNWICRQPLPPNHY